MDRFSKYLKATAGEMKHVSWPTQTQALVYSALVIGISAITALYTSAFDYVFTNLLDFVV